ncbi:MAG: glucosamine-6-phosphate deaminase [Atribacterota bacterium]|jgi:glucosamine-6-phosphate deaminase|nr:glucosamine-6-phosphate deaminase [Atribacterota bacterium]
MNIIKVKNYKELSMQAAGIVAAQISRKKNTVLGLPTGQTPLGMYQELIKRFRKGEIDFSQVITFNLDEYYGLSPEHPQSYNYYMWQTFFNNINIKKENVFIPDGVTKDVQKECRYYESLIEKKGGIDLQFLGIGDNGHIGFNEPAIALNSKTHLVNLSQATIEANSRFFNDIEDVPRKALTMGMGTIMKAKQIILLASGMKKAPAIAKTINGKVNTEVPASLLQLHRDVTIIVDKDAARDV